ASVAEASYGTALRRAGVHPEGPELPNPLPGSRTLPVPLRVVLGLDESGSTTSSDPNRESHGATLIICDWLASHSQDARDEIGVVRFADRADTIAPAAAARAAAEIEL